MNERILEIANQVEGTYDASDDFCIKFAQLIIQECQKATDKYIANCGEVACLPEYVFQNHFGVK